MPLFSNFFLNPRLVPYIDWSCSAWILVSFCTFCSSPLSFLDEETQTACIIEDTNGPWIYRVPQRHSIPSLPCSACNWLWPLPTTTCSNPKILLQSSTRLHYLLPMLCHLPPIFLHIYLPFYLDSCSPSELPPRPPHHHPQKLHLTSKLSHPSAHLQFNMSRLKIILVPVRNCPMFTCLGLKRVSEKQRFNFCYRSFGSSQKCVSQIFTLTLRAGPNTCPRS